MVILIITIAVITASVTSAPATRQMRGLVNAVVDLSMVRVGTPAGSATVGFHGAGVAAGNVHVPSAASGRGRYSRTM
jgi:hypothetical protein